MRHTYQMNLRIANLGRLAKEGNRSRRNVFDRQTRSLAHGSGMEESLSHRRTHRGPAFAERINDSNAHVGAHTRGRSDLRGIDFAV
jgi:hypothetical protein